MEVALSEKARLIIFYFFSSILVVYYNVRDLVL